MRFLLPLFFLGLLPAWAGLVNAVSVVVNDEPITLYEIDEKARALKVSASEALNVLIDQKIQESEIKRMGIEVTPFEIDERMESIAASNNLTLTEFKEVLASRFISLEAYRKDLSDKALQEKVAQAIMTEESTSVEREDARIYYDNHTDEFDIPKKVKVTKYASSNRQQLLAYLRNPMMINSGVAVEKETIDTASMNPQLFSMVMETPVGSYTPMLPMGQNLYVSIRVDEKIDTVKRKFEEVEGMIVAKLRKDNESKAIERYFQKQRAKAKIVTLRRP